jgi:phosphate ABC transporter, permease protein PstC
MTHITLAARSRQGSGRLADRLFRGSSRFAAFVLVFLLIAIGVLLFANSRLTWETFGLSFITGLTWDPVASVYGALPFIVGTVLASLIAIVIAAPIGIMTSLYLSELAPRRTATPLTFMIELLAAIPSVVIGLWGVFMLAPFLRGTVETWIVSVFGWIPFLGGPTYGIGLFTAGVILAIMILPTIVTISREVIQAVPGSQREAMFALGATRWEVIRHAVVPFARSGIIGAVILGMGRALGETMAVTMVIGNKDAIPITLFDQTQTIASKIATSFNEAQIGIQTSSLIALGLILLAMTIIMNIVARLVVWRVAGPTGAP